MTIALCGDFVLFKLGGVDMSRIDALILGMLILNTYLGIRKKDRQDICVSIVVAVFYLVSLFI
jgi:hypothetical protein